MSQDTGDIVTAPQDKAAVVGVLEMGGTPVVDTPQDARGALRIRVRQERRFVIYARKLGTVTRAVIYTERDTDYPAGNRAKIVGLDRKVRIHKPEILELGKLVRSAADTREETETFVIRGIGIEQARNHVPVAIEHTGETIDRVPRDIIQRGFSILERAILFQHVAIHHDVVREARTGRPFPCIAVGSVHDGGKTVEFGCRLDDVAARIVLRRSFHLVPAGIEYLRARCIRAHGLHPVPAKVLLGVPAHENVAIAGNLLREFRAQAFRIFFDHAGIHSAAVRIERNGSDRHELAPDRSVGICCGDMRERIALELGIAEPAEILVARALDIGNPDRETLRGRNFNILATVRIESDCPCLEGRILHLARKHGMGIRTHVLAPDGALETRIVIGMHEACNRAVRKLCRRDCRTVMLVAAGSDIEYVVDHFQGIALLADNGLDIDGSFLFVEFHLAQVHHVNKRASIAPVFAHDTAGRRIRRNSPQVVGVDNPRPVHVVDATDNAACTAPRKDGALVEAVPDNVTAITARRATNQAPRKAPTHNHAIKRDVVENRGHIRIRMADNAAHFEFSAEIGALHT